MPREEDHRLPTIQDTRLMLYPRTRSGSLLGGELKDEISGVAEGRWGTPAEVPSVSMSLMSRYNNLDRSRSLAWRQNNCELIDFF